jgi:phage gp29-like protein
MFQRLQKLLGRSRPQPQRLARFKSSLDGDDRWVALAPNMGKSAIPHESTFQQRLYSGSGKVVYYNSDEAIRQSREDAAKMLSDLSIWKPLDERIRETALLKWHLEPEDKSDVAQDQFAKDVTKMIERIPRFLEFKRNLLMAIFHGRYGVGYEWGWEFYKQTPFLTVRTWHPVHGDKLFFSAKGDVGIRVGWWPELNDFKYDMTIEGRVIWLDDYLRQFYAIHHHHVMDGPTEDVYSAGRMFGTGVRSFVYWAWQHKNLMLQWAMDAWARYGAGFSIWYYTEGDQNSFDTVKALAENQYNSTAVILPRPLEGDTRGPGFEHTEMQHVGLKQMKDVITDYFEAKIENYIIGQTLSSNTGSTGLGSNVADLHKETKNGIIRSDAINLQETMTKDLVKPLVAYNRRRFPAWPDIQLKFVFDLEETDVKDTLAAALDLSQLGVELDPDELRSLVGLRKPQNAGLSLPTGRVEAPTGEPAALPSVHHADPAKMSRKQRLEAAAQLLLWSEA